jgi:SAM-dependent methyltransferase
VLSDPEKEIHMATHTHPAPTPALDEEKVGAFVNLVVGELGATLNAALVVIGDELGLYRAMDGAGGITPGQLAERTGTSERYVREWLNAQAAGGYVDYDPSEKRYSLPPEHAVALVDEASPFFMPGAFQLMTASLRDEPKIREAFRSGAGVGWHEHNHGVFEGCERFFRPGYAAHLVSEWIPALDGVEDKLHAGAQVADVGCGLGASTILMAQAYPASTFVGFDYHDESIETARERAEAAGVADRVRFEVAPAAEFPGTGYDLVTAFDCLHDMGDPVGAARHVRASLAQDGTWLVVEPFAGDRVEDNLNPVGRVYYGASTLLCTPASLSQDVGLALGAQAGESRLRDVVTGGGFTRFRRAAETPFNLVLEARP